MKYMLCLFIFGIKYVSQLALFYDHRFSLFLLESCTPKIRIVGYFDIIYFLQLNYRCNKINDKKRNQPQRKNGA